jgi:hypothetical protein
LVQRLDRLDSFYCVVPFTERAHDNHCYRR